MARRCKNCKSKVQVGAGGIITPAISLCSWSCFETYIKSQNFEQLKAKAERAELRERKERLLVHNDHLKAAQHAFNGYIRVRDKHKQCISCDVMLDGDKLGGRFDAGHYRTRGSNSRHPGYGLRFNPLNTFGQCKRCNRHLAGNHSNMRRGIVRRYGAGRANWLDNHAGLRMFTVTELKRIKRIYLKKRRIYERLFR